MIKAVITMKKIFDNKKVVLFDGGMGTMLQKGVLKDGELPELLNITNPDAILFVHKMYVDAGCDVVTTNTFGANRRKLKTSEKVNEVITKGVTTAKKSGAKYVALDIGPLGTMLKPYGDMDFNKAYDLFKEQVLAGKNAGADLVVIETMSDLKEAKAALLAVKENSDLPCVVTMSFESDGRTFLGTTPEIAAVTFSSMGADMVGINCSLGPKEIIDFVSRMLTVSRVPVIVQPNAGLPSIVDGNTVYNISPDEFALHVKTMLEMGVKAVGGCCGTTPEHIKTVKNLIDHNVFNEFEPKFVTAFTSSQNCVLIDNNQTCVIGERINPTGKKRLKQALKDNDMSYIISEAISQTEAGADVLDVNAGLPDIDEKFMLTKMVNEIQAITPLPLQIDSTDAIAIESAVREYSGKPIINSVNGKTESMEQIFPIAKKYGASVVALTLDENGIPDKAEDRISIAKRIIEKAKDYGIPKQDILIDCLVLTASTNQHTVTQTLKAVSMAKNILGVNTVLGVSNVSFGLPNRPLVNSTFLSAAFGCGLTAPILNPLSKEYMDVVNSFRLLNNEENSMENYIDKYSGFNADKQNSDSSLLSVEDIIIKGYKALCADAVRKLIDTGIEPMEIINSKFIPALNIVGDKFEKGEMFLPQLMASAETAKNGFDVLAGIGKTDKCADNDKKIILATVKGDIHDIGKNIVKMILQNYGYNVIDLGKDVEPDIIVDNIKNSGAKLVGLSALMTTTVKYMQQTVELIKQKCPDCKIMVGGAVLTEEYTKMIGADFYAKDALEGAKIAEKVFG